MISQYRSFAVKLRSESILDRGDWIHFISAHHEIQCRPELFQLYKLSCLCLPPLVDTPPIFTIPLPKLASDVEMFESCIRSLQMSCLTVPHVSSLYKNPKSVCRVFRLLGRTRIRFVSGYKVFRLAAMLGKMEAEYWKAILQYDRPVATSNTTTPSVSRASRVYSTLSPDLTLGKVNVSLSRCSEAAQENVAKRGNSNAGKGKKI